MLDLNMLNHDFVLRPGAKVVLSACESGSVLPNLSSEVISLAGGIMAAGAEAVVSSFWKVGDVPACLLFDRFYENLVGRGMGAASALKAAQLALREMDEARVHERLSAILKESGRAADPSYAGILAAFSARRTDVHPFDSLVDWAAFFLMGAA
jgi:CHAT domain-containing protein